MEQKTTLYLTDIPDHLKNSLFYESLSKNDSSFQIENRYFKKDLIVTSDEDLIHLINTINFWGCCNFKPPIETVGYIISRKNTIEHILKEMGAEHFFNFIKLDFDLIRKYVDEDFDGYEESMISIFEIKITKKHLFKIYAVHTIATECNMTYLYLQITDPSMQKLFVVNCVATDDKFALVTFQNSNLLNNCKIWKKVLNGGHKNVLEYMIENKFVYGLCKNAVNYIKECQACYINQFDYEHVSLKSMKIINKQDEKYTECIELINLYFSQETKITNRQI